MITRIWKLTILAAMAAALTGGAVSADVLSLPGEVPEPVVMSRTMPPDPPRPKPKPKRHGVTRAANDAAPAVA